MITVSRRYLIIYSFLLKYSSINDLYHEKLHVFSYVIISIFRLSVISSAVMLLEQYTSVYCDYPSYKEIFSPIKCQCGKLPVENYPNSLKKQIKRLTDNITEKMNSKRMPLVMQKKKPPALKMFEPRIEEVYVFYFSFIILLSTFL